MQRRAASSEELPWPASGGGGRVATQADKPGTTSQCEPTRQTPVPCAFSSSTRRTPSAACFQSAEKESKRASDNVASTAATASPAALAATTAARSSWSSRGEGVGRYYASSLNSSLTSIRDGVPVR